VHELQASEPQIRMRESRLDSGGRAAPIIPQVKIAQAAEGRATEARRACDTSVTRYAKAAAAHRQVQSRAGEAAATAEELPVLDERISGLDRLLGRMQPRPQLAAELAEAQKAQLAAGRDLKDAQAALRQAEQELTGAQTQLHEQDGQLANVSFDRVLFELLDGVREGISRVFGASRDADAITIDIRAAKARLEARQDALAKQNAAAEKAQAEAVDAAANLSAMQREEVAARHLAGAALLRQELRLGEPCPVCEYPVAAHPSPLATPVLDELQKRLTQARRAETKARQATDQVRTAAAEAGAAETMEREALDQLRRRHEEALTALAQARAVLTEKLGGRLAIAADKLVEEQAQEAYRAAADAKAKHETGRLARDEAERAVRDLEQARAQAQTATTRHQERLHHFEERSSELGRQIAEIDEEIRKVTTAADPAAERTVL
jgi:exonuclease SbcC